jgi:ubiquitin-conjugating enzyme E2 W
MAQSQQQLKRISKELQRFREATVEGVSFLCIETDRWIIKIEGACLINSLYRGETFTLQVRFTKEYPFDSPEVLFVGESPVHEHIYSNGHICLNILGSDWSPALTVNTVVLSIISMLSSGKHVFR